MGCKACQAPLSMGILQATILEWVAFPFSRGSSQLRDQTQAGLPHCSWILYQLSHKGSSQILEWVAYPFSRGSSQPRNRTGVSCIAGLSFCSPWSRKELDMTVRVQDSQTDQFYLEYKGARSAVCSSWGPHSSSLTFLCSFFAGFSLPCLLATPILDSCLLFSLPNNNIPAG